MAQRRRLRIGFMVAIGASGLLGWSADARAANMDPAPERLVTQPSFPSNLAGATCQSIAGDPESAIAAGSSPNLFPCRPDNVAFRNLVSEFGFAIAPSAMHPARTLGISGFSISIETTFTSIHPDARVGIGAATRSFWQDGTQGPTDATTRQSSIINRNPDSLLQVYSLKVAKGLPFGLEIAGALGYVGNTSLWTVGGDLRWSIFEGFRRGFPGALPDVAVGGGVRTLAGSAKLNITAIGIDAQVSKPITLDDTATLTPYVGYQRLIIIGNSSLIDLTPNVDGYQQCGYAGTKSGEKDPATGAALPPEQRNGSPACRNKLSNGQDNNADLNNNVSFEKVVIHRHRALAGLRYRYEFIQLGAHVAADITAPSDENPGIVGGRQWTVGFEGGVRF